MTLKILLVDDHTILRQGLRALIEKNPGTVVAGEACNGAEAVRMAGELQPDIVIMDLTMPIMSGIEATREISRHHPDIKVLALSMECERAFVIEAIRAGASGYLLKDAAFAEIADAIDTITKGETYLPRKIATLIVKEFLQRIPDELTAVYETLTIRERDILQMIADGRNSKEIATVIGSSAKTVDNQRIAIMQKLQIFSIAELTKYAVKHGLTTLGK